VVPFIDKKFWHLKKKNIKPVLIIGLLIALQISSFNLAMTLTTIANAVIFWSVAPFFVFIFSTFFLKEKVRKEHIVVFVVAFIGLLIAKPLSGGHVVGNLIALLTGAFYAATITYMRYEGETDSASMIFWYMFMASVYLLPALFILGPGQLDKMIYYETLGFSLPVILWVVGLGVISTGVAYIFIALVLKKINAIIYSLIDIIVSPIVAGILGFIIFNEVPTINVVIGGFFLLSSGFVLTAYMSDREKHFVQKFIDKHFKKIDVDEIESIADTKIIK
jgi:drug/metabolite transporter (DMT)-like permease